MPTNAKIICRAARATTKILFGAEFAVKKPIQLPMIDMIATHGLTNIASIVGTCDARVDVKNPRFNFIGEYVIKIARAVKIPAKTIS